MNSTSRDWTEQWRQWKTKGFADGAILRSLQQHAKKSVQSYSQSRWRSTQWHNDDDLLKEREREREKVKNEERENKKDRERTVLGIIKHYFKANGE